LTAELAAWTKLVGSGPPQARAVIAQALQHWQKDTDLAAVRDPEALARLSAEERKACAALWAEVAALLKQAQGDRP
jgi:hypothetical protein